MGQSKFLAIDSGTLTDMANVLVVLLPSSPTKAGLRCDVFIVKSAYCVWGRENVRVSVVL